MQNGYASSDCENAFYECNSGVRLTDVVAFYAQILLQALYFLDIAFCAHDHQLAMLISPKLKGRKTKALQNDACRVQSYEVAIAVDFQAAPLECLAHQLRWTIR